MWITRRLFCLKKVNDIILALQRHGYEAYAIGGCVRDSLLGREPEDWDITTSATPVEVKAIFPRTFDTGIQHGTVTVLLDKEGFEVTTYRIDGKYEDSRHPKEVTFTACLKEDLRRRDFTINAMAYHPERGLVDLFHGMEDMEHKIRPNTKAIIVLHASNVCGTIVPVEEIGKICRERQIYFVVDTAQSAGTIPVDMKKTELISLLLPAIKVF